jgi:hypothetical protein
MPGSSTTPGWAGARNIASVHVAFRDFDHVGARNYQAFAAQWLAYALPCRRFDSTLADAAARLGADAVCYSFIAADFHRLLSAGFYRRTKSLEFCTRHRVALLRMRLILSSSGSKFAVKPLAAKRLRHDFAELPIEITLVSIAGKVNDPTLVEHIEPVFLQLWLQQLAHVRLDQDQRDSVPAGSQQPLEVAAKLLVVPGDHEIGCRSQ